MDLLKPFRRVPPRLTPDEYLQKLLDKGLREDGQPELDPVPLAPPIGYKKHPSMVEIVRDMVRGEKLRLEALESGHESFEEAEDFDIDDDGPVLRSEHENVSDPTLNDLLAAGAAEKAAKEKSALPPVPATPAPEKAPEPPKAAPEAPKPVIPGIDTPV